MDILVVGTGSIGRRHIGNLISIGQRDITAVDKDPKSLDEVKKYYNDIRTINTKEVVSFKDYDAVFICTHPDSHLALLKKAIDGGCHCFMEKPFALTAEGIEPLLKKAKGKNLKIMTGFNMRYLPLILELKKKLAEDVVGKILSCRISLSSYMPNWHPEEDYRKSFMAFNATGGGALFDYVHGLDLAQWLAGSIEKLFCIKRTSLLQMETDDMAILVGQTRTDAVVVFYFDFVDRVHRKTIDIVGTKGTIIWHYAEEESVRYYTVDTNKWTEICRKPDYNSCYVLEIEDFFNAIRNNGKVESDGYNGLSIMRLLDVAREGNLSGKAIRI